jgi:hypothetical protein
MKTLKIKLLKNNLGLKAFFFVAESADVLTVYTLENCVYTFDCQPVSNGF